jgi:ubiquinone/menaquinone biosynthesis C-methylase UbiE
MREYSNSNWVEEVDFFCRSCSSLEKKATIDVGCGIGYVLKKIPRKNNLLVGLDVNRSLVKHARKECQGKEYHFMVADACKLPVTNNVFDDVFMVEVIEHLREPNAALAECVRILRPKGRLLLTTPNGLFYKAFHHRSMVSPYHVDEYTVSEVVRLIQNSGLSLSKLRVSTRLPLKRILRILGKVPLIAPLVPGRYYIEARKK